MAYLNGYYVPGPSTHSYPNSDFVGVSIKQNQGLLMACPRGYYNHIFAGDPQPLDQYGTVDPQLLSEAELRTQITGDFDVQVDFSEFQALRTANFPMVFEAGLVVQDTPLEQTHTQDPTPRNKVSVCRTLNGHAIQTRGASVRADLAAGSD